MNMNDWTYCQIQFQILDDGRGTSDFNGLANRQMWIRFIAQSENKTIRESIKLPIHTSSRIPLTPDKNSLAQKQVLTKLVDTLEYDGWEVVDEGSGEWWQIRLRRDTPYQPPQKAKPKFRDWLIGGIILIPLVIGILLNLSNFIGLNAYSHYSKAGLELTPSTSAPLVEQLVIIDLSNRELDPLQDLIPADLAAEDPQNAETVVWLDCETDSNWRGSTTNCAVTVIDWSEKQILDERLIEGEFTLHPEEGAPQSEVVGNRNNQAILDYLNKLPRK